MSTANGATKLQWCRTGIIMKGERTHGIVVVVVHWREEKRRHRR